MADSNENGNSRGIDRVAVGRKRLGINNPASKSNGEAGENCIPWTDTQQEGHNQTDGGIPGNESDTRKENNLGPIQQQV